MTPKRNFTAAPKASFQKHLRRTFYTIGITAFTACGSLALPSPIDDVAVEPYRSADANRPADAQAQITHDLERLTALDVLEVDGVIAESTSHMWVPYGGFWSESSHELSTEEQAARLKHFVDTASEAVADVDLESGLDEGSDLEAFLYPIGSGDGSPAFCLTTVMHEANLAHLTGLEIVDADDIVRDDEAVSGQCYSSWITVSEQEALRALKLRAIVDATLSFDSGTEPEAPGLD